MRFVALMLLLLLGSFGLSVGAILYGRWHTESDAMQAVRLDVCGVSPCYSGIIPNITSWSDAQSHLQTVASEIYTAQIVVNDRALRIEVARNGGTHDLVGWITIHDFPGLTLPSLGYFIDRFGEPCGVIVAGDINPPDVQIQFPYMDIRLDTPVGEGLRPGSKVADVYLGVRDIKPSLGNERCADWNSPDVKMASWRGFTSPDTYYAVLRQH